MPARRAPRKLAAGAFTAYRRYARYEYDRGDGTRTIVRRTLHAQQLKKGTPRKNENLIACRVPGAALSRMVLVRSLYEKAFLRYFNFSHAPYQCMCDVIVAMCENTWILNLTFFRTKVTSESSLPSRLSRCNAKLLCC